MKMCPTDKKDLENPYSGNSFRNFQLNVAIMKLKHDFFKSDLKEPGYKPKCVVYVPPPP